MLTFLYIINESKEQEVCSFWEVVDSLYALQTTGVVLSSQLDSAVKKCGSLLSKFNFSNNKIDPAMIMTMTMTMTMMMMMMMMMMMITLFKCRMYLAL